MTDEKKKDDGFTSFAKLMMGDNDFRSHTLMTAVALMIRNINAIENRLDALEKAVSKSDLESQKKERKEQDIQAIQDGIDAGVITDEEAGMLMMVMAKKEQSE